MLGKIKNKLKSKGIVCFIGLLFLRILSIVIALPVALLIILVSPIIYIRVIKLFSYRIGHYALNTELILCASDINLFNKNKFTKNIFYTPSNEPICNEQLHKMWKRVIIILPFSSICEWLDKLLTYFYRNDHIKNIFETSDGDYDRWKLFEKIK